MSLDFYWIDKARGNAFLVVAGEKKVYGDIAMVSPEFRKKAERLFAGEELTIKPNQIAVVDADGDLICCLQD